MAFVSNTRRGLVFWHAWRQQQYSCFSSLCALPHLSEAGMAMPGFYMMQQLRWYPRPRGSLWRGRKLLGKEAVLVVEELKRSKTDSARVGNVMQNKVSRLLKHDALQVLGELQWQNEVDLSIKVFDAIRKEVWYKPDEYLYKDMLSCLGKNKRIKECRNIFQELKKEGLKPNCLLCQELMAAYLESRMVSDAMEVYEEMKHSDYPLEAITFRVLMSGLKKLGKTTLRNKVRKEYLDYFQGIEGEPESTSETSEEEY